VKGVCWALAAASWCSFFGVASHVALWGSLTGQPQVRGCRASLRRIRVFGGHSRGSEAPPLPLTLTLALSWPGHTSTCLTICRRGDSPGSADSLRLGAVAAWRWSLAVPGRGLALWQEALFQHATQRLWNTFHACWVRE
jgi:hypothetical protein